MCFADYFSRHPTSASIPISGEEKKFKNLIDSFKFMLKKADKIPPNRITASTPVQNDVIQTVQRKQTEQHAFRYSRNTKQSHSINPLMVNVCTKSKPNVNTYDQKITKRFRGPNKKDMSSIERADTPPDYPNY